MKTSNETNAPRAIFTTQEGIDAWLGLPTPAWMGYHTPSKEQLAASAVAHIRELDADEAELAVEDGADLGVNVNPENVRIVDLYTGGQWVSSVECASDECLDRARSMVTTAEVNYHG